MPTNEADAFADLPSALATRHADLLKAMVNGKDPVSWDDGEGYVEAHAPAAIAKILIGVWHAMLRARPIAFLWRQKMNRNGKTTLGKASVAGGKVKYFGDVDFVIDFNWEAWQHLTARQRIALIDHELMHCAVDGETMKPIMVPHDVEEFGTIVSRWGLWKPDLEEFGERVRETAQLGLSFETAGA